MTYDINDPAVRGPQTWKGTGVPLEPFDMVKYDSARPYHPDKANMGWQVTSITVSMIGPDTYEFFDQDDFCLNPNAPFWGRLPKLNEILDFLQGME